MPPRYTDEFKIDAIKQVLENGYGVTETAERLGIHQELKRSYRREGYF